MSQDRNEITLVGAVCSEPALRHTSGGSCFLSFRMVTKTEWTDRQSGETRERSAYHNVKMWGAAAETLSRQISEHMRLEVTGAIKYESWEDRETGQKKYSTVIDPNNVKRADGEHFNSSAPPPAAPQGGGGYDGGYKDDDIPF